MVAGAPLLRVSLVILRKATAHRGGTAARSALRDQRYLKQLAELFNRKTGIANDSAQCKGIDWVVPRNGEDTRAVRHDGMLALTDHYKAHFFEGAYHIEMIDARNLRQA